MGQPKLALPFGQEMMLGRVARRMSEAVEPIIVAAAPGQTLPALPATVRVVRDRREGRGPLEGLAAGLTELRERVDVAFVTACDVPLLVPNFVRRMLELVEGHDVAVPHIDGYDQPLAAVYSCGVLPHVERLLAANRLRPAYLFDLVRTRRVAADELTCVDPRLESLFNVNSPEDYELSLRRAGIEP
jgi:molybdopterin-guanine dinucleotide biosynthesis protein A